MSSIFKIKDGFNNYTASEKRIATYILENKDNVINESSHVVALKTDTSAATVVRFAKRLGFNGFTNLKVQLAKDHKPLIQDTYDTMIQEGDSLTTMIQKAEIANQETFRKTYRLINLEDLEKAIAVLSKAKRVYLFGVGGAAVICHDLYHKLTRIGINCFFQEDSHIMIPSLSHATSDDVVIAMSYSGRTKEVVFAQELAKNCGATTIAMTASRKSPIMKFTDIVLLVPQEEKALRLGAISSRFALLALSDLLYFGVAKQNITDTQKSLATTRTLIDAMQK